jgi:transposase
MHMARRRFQLSERQVRELTSAYSVCKDGATRTRLQAVRLYGSGYATEEVMGITGCSRTSLMEWCRAYRRGGAEALVDRRVGGNRAKLTAAELEDLKHRLTEYTPGQLFGPTASTPAGQFWTAPDLRRAVDRWYGVTYHSSSSYYRLFQLCGFSYQHPAKVYKSRSAAKVAEFEEQLEKN